MNWGGKTAWGKLISKTELQVKLNHHATSGLGDQKKLWPDQEETVTRKAALAPDFPTCAVFRVSLSWNLKSKQQVPKLCFWSNETMDATRKYRSCGHEATETQKAKGERGRARTNVRWLWTDVSWLDGIEKGKQKWCWAWPTSKEHFQWARGWRQGHRLNGNLRKYLSNCLYSLG